MLVVISPATKLNENHREHAAKTQPILKQRVKSWYVKCRAKFTWRYRTWCEYLRIRVRSSAHFIGTLRLATPTLCSSALSASNGRSSKDTKGHSSLRLLGNENFWRFRLAGRTNCGPISSELCQPWVLWGHSNRDVKADCYHADISERKLDGPKIVSFYSKQIRGVLAHFVL